MHKTYWMVQARKALLEGQTKTASVQKKPHLSPNARYGNGECT